MLTALSLLTAVKTSEWHRYTGYDFTPMDGYATAGTTGPDAVNLRCALPAHFFGQPAFIEYQHVGSEQWLPTGYAAVMRYDSSRDHEPDGEGYEFIPYRVTDLSTVTR